MRAALRALAHLHVPLLVAASALLSLGAALGDSATIDEPGHLAAGLAALHAGDFRLAPDHPPLVRLWAALPVFVLPHEWPAADAPGWADGNFFRFGRELFARNDPERLLLPARAMMVGLLCATGAAVWATTSRLFGPRAATLALVVAAFDPGLLAHGHYVTTDLPMALAALVCVATFARLLREVTPGRVLAAGAALGTAFLVKFTSLLLLPALAVMALLAALRRTPLTLRWPGRPAREIVSGGRRAAALAAVLAVIGLVLMVGIWAGYGFRYQALRGPDAASATMYPLALFGPPAPANMDEAWDLLLRDPRTGDARSGLVPGTVRIARRHRLLPEAYLFGMAALGRHQAGRLTYLAGEISFGGRAEYFPLAFLWKTPLPTLLLFAMGLGALATRRAPVGDALLGAGLAVFAATYAAASLAADLNIGHRHLLPLYPPIFAVAGAGWAWAGTRAGRVAAVALGCSLAASASWTAPDFLGSFNALAGGPREGYRRLADSNVDWSQDLVRLREWMRGQPGETVALLQSGHAPWPRGLDARPLLPREPGEPVAALAPGVYVVSANELLGLFKPFQRATTWRDPRLLQVYEALWRGGRFETREAQESFDALRRARLVARLGARPADERIGSSLFVYRLSAAEIDVLTRP